MMVRSGTLVLVWLAAKAGGFRSIASSTTKESNGTESLEIEKPMEIDTKPAPALEGLTQNLSLVPNDASAGELEELDTSTCLRASHAGSSGWTAYDRKWKIEAPPGHTIGRIESKHHNGYEDRSWKFGYSKIVPAIPLEDAKWTGWVNNWDGQATALCGSDSVLTGIESEHYNRAEDRRWNIKCAKFRTSSSYVTEVTSGGWSGYVNNWDGNVKDFPDEGDQFRIRSGIDSYHHNRKEDRKFRFAFRKICFKKKEVAANCRNVKVHGYWQYSTYLPIAGSSLEVMHGTDIRSGEERQSTWSTDVTRTTEVSLTVGSQWPLAVSASVSKGVSRSVGMSMATSISRETGTVMTTGFTRALAPGALWQWMFGVDDSCGQAEVRTMEFISTSNGGLYPCCPPGRSENGKTGGHGPCVHKDECICDQATCDQLHS